MRNCCEIAALLFVTRDDNNLCPFRPRPPAPSPRVISLMKSAFFSESEKFTFHR